MSLYIRKMIIEDNNKIVFSIENKPAEIALYKALDFIRVKDGNIGLKRAFKAYFRSIDKEMKEYFDFGGNFG